MEPVSSTNGQKEQSEEFEAPRKLEKIEKFERPENSDQARNKPPIQTDDFENDPEAGPSGLQTEPRRSNHSKIVNMHRKLRYQNDSSSDDDSADERDAQETASAMWLNSHESFRFNRKENESNDKNYFNPSFRFDQAIEPSNEASASANNQDDEVIELSENESVQSNVIVETTPNGENRNLEVNLLTAPDLQLDWASDTSSDNEIVCTIRSRSPVRSVALNLSRSNLNASQAETDLTAIDLTASDDEEANFSHENITMLAPGEQFRSQFSHHLQELRRKLTYHRQLRSSIYPDDDRLDR